MNRRSPPAHRPWSNGRLVTARASNCRVCTGAGPRALPFDRSGAYSLDTLLGRPTRTPALHGACWPRVVGGVVTWRSSCAPAAVTADRCRAIVDRRRTWRLGHHAWREARYHLPHTARARMRCPSRRSDAGHRPLEDAPRHFHQLLDAGPGTRIGDLWQGRFNKLAPPAAACRVSRAVGGVVPPCTRRRSRPLRDLPAWIVARPERTRFAVRFLWCR